MAINYIFKTVKHNKLFNNINIISHIEERLNTSEDICKVNFTSKNEKFWSFYLKSGALIWATDNEHPLRRLHRAVTKVCPQVDSRDLKLRETERSELWEYLAIKVLYQRQKITIEQATLLIQEYIAEVLFDCCQNSQNINQVEDIYANSHNFMGAILRHPLLKEPLTEIDFSSLQTQVLKSWQNWQNAGLEKYSPNLAIVIKDKNQFKTSTEESTYQKLTLLINGTRTIRDLSVLTRKDPLELINVFLPYINTNLMELKAIPDEKIPTHKSSSTNNQPSRSVFKEIHQPVEPEPTNKPLVMCIDDSPTINAQMRKILEPENYRVILIEEPYKALKIMLENKPNIIFLDLVMPITNGYEICSQIKKMPSLQDIPIVIITSNDSIMARTRTAILGVADFITKPLKTEEIVSLTHKYLEKFQDSNQNFSRLI